MSNKIFEFYFKSSNYKASWVLGMHELSYDENNAYNPKEKKIHPDFINYPFWSYFDFAIVVLDRTIAFNQNVNPICLPSLKDRFEGKMLTVAGW